MAQKNSRRGIRLLPPRRLSLSSAQYDEALALLAELLLDAAAKRREGRPGGVINGASGGVIGCVVPLPQKRRNGREAA